MEIHFKSLRISEHFSYAIAQHISYPQFTHFFFSKFSHFSRAPIQAIIFEERRQLGLIGMFVFSYSFDTDKAFIRGTRCNYQHHYLHCKFDPRNDDHRKTMSSSADNNNPAPPIHISSKDRRAF